MVEGPLSDITDGRGENFMAEGSGSAEAAAAGGSARSGKRERKRGASPRPGSGDVAGGSPAEGVKRRRAARRGAGADAEGGAAAPSVLQDGSYKDILLTIFRFFISESAGVDTETLGSIGGVCRLWAELHASPHLWRSAPLELPSGRINWAVVQQLSLHYTGTEGKCFKCRLRSTGEQVAVRQPRVPEGSEGIPYYMLRELAVLERIRHANVCTPSFVHLKNSRLNFFFGFVERNLQHYMARRGGGGEDGVYGEGRAEPLPEEDARHLMRQLLCAVDHCHARGILHRNIKVNHLLITPGSDPDRPLHGASLKLADFALVRLSSVPQRPYTPSVMTLWYRPPEILLGAPAYGPAVDVWAVGCIFAHLLSGAVPFPGCSEVDMLFRIFGALGTPTEETWPGWRTLPHCDIAFPAWTHRRLGLLFPRPGARPSAPALALLEGLWRYDPSRRLSAFDALREPWARAGSGSGSADPPARGLAHLGRTAPSLWTAERPSHRFADALLEAEEELWRRRSAASSLPAERSAAQKRLRSVLVDWVLDVVDTYDMSPRSAFLCLRIFDRYRAGADLAEGTELASASCLHLASKCEDVHYIGAAELVNCTRGAFELPQLLEKEDEVLRSIGFQLSMPALVDFVEVLLREMSRADAAAPKDLHMARVLAEAALFCDLDHHLRASEVAAVLVPLALFLGGAADYWARAAPYVKPFFSALRGPEPPRAVAARVVAAARAETLKDSALLRKYAFEGGGGAPAQVVRAVAHPPVAAFSIYPEGAGTGGEGRGGCGGSLRGLRG